MKCPECGSQLDKTIDSRPIEGGAVTRRRRECLNCRVRWTTYERMEPMPDNAMPQYRCHKVVRAVKLAEVMIEQLPATVDLMNDHDPWFDANPYAHLLHEGGAVAVSYKWFLKHMPKPGGYYVAYDDGYTSWSPAEAFEAGYTRIE